MGQLTAEQLRVTEGGTPAAVTSVRRAQDSGTPLALVVTLDTSGSMQGASMEQAQAAATALLQRLAPDDVAAVVSFSDDAQLVQPLSADRAAGQRAVAGLVAVGNTALYDAVAESARVASESGRARRAVVLLSDGREFGGASQLTREESVERAARVGAVFYMVGVGPDIDTAYLDEIATRSGGRFFRASGAGEVQQIYAALEELLRAQFVVRLRSNASPAGVERQIGIEVRTADGDGKSERAYTSSRPAAAVAPPTVVSAPAPDTSAIEPAPAVPIDRDLLEAGAVIVAGGLAGMATMGGAAYYFGRVRRRRKSPVQLRALRRGEDVVSARPDRGAARAAVESGLAHATPRSASAGVVAASRLANPGAMLTAALRVRTGGSKGASVPLGPGNAVIGTDEDCEIRLDASAGVAGRHARIVWREGHALIEHLAPEYETRVNGRTVDRAPLDAGYEITIGPSLVLRFEVGPPRDDASASARRRVA